MESRVSVLYASLSRGRSLALSPALSLWVTDQYHGEDEWLCVYLCYCNMMGFAYSALLWVSLSRELMSPCFMKKLVSEAGSLKKFFIEHQRVKYFYSLYSTNETARVIKTSNSLVHQRVVTVGCVRLCFLPAVLIHFIEKHEVEGVIRVTERESELINFWRQQWQRSMESKGTWSRDEWERCSVSERARRRCEPSKRWAEKMQNMINHQRWSSHHCSYWSALGTSLLPLFFAAFFCLSFFWYPFRMITIYRGSDFHHFLISI